MLIYIYFMKLYNMRIIFYNSYPVFYSQVDQEFY